MRKKIVSVLAVITIFILCVIIMWQPLCNVIADHVLSSYCQKKFGKKLSYESIEFKKGQLIINKPFLGKSEDITLRTGYYLKSDELLIHYQIDWLNGIVDTHFDLEKPHLSIVKQGDRLPALKNTQRVSWWNFKKQFEITDGIVELIDISNPEPSKQLIHVAVDAVNGNQGEFRVFVKYLNSHHSDHSLVFTVQSGEKDLLALVQVNQTQCDDLSQSYTFFSNQLDKKGWQFLNGSVSGNIFLKFSPSYYPIVEGILNYQDLKLMHHDLPIMCVIPEVTLNLKEQEPLLIDTKKDSLEKGALIRSILQHNTGAWLLHKEAKIICYDDHWSIQHLHGKIEFENNKVSSLAIEGSLYNQGEVNKLSLQGRGYFFDASGFPEGELNLHIKPSNRPEVKVRLIGGHTVLNQHTISVKLSDLQEKECTLMQDFLGFYYPEFKQTSIENGLLSAEAHITLEARDIKRVEVDHFTMHQADISSPTGLFKAAFKEISGTVALDYSVPNPMSTLDMNVMVSDGRMYFEHYTPSQLHFLDVQGQVAIRKGQVQQSLIQADFAGLKGIFEWNRFSTDAVSKLNVMGRLGNVITLIPEHFQKHLDKKLVDREVTLQVVAKSLGEVLDVTGSLLIDPFDREKDEIQFGFGLQLPKLFSSHPAASELDQEWYLAQSLLSHLHPLFSRASSYIVSEWDAVIPGLKEWDIRDGWFKAKHFPIDKYLTPFELQDLPLSLVGFMDFDGFFDLEKVFLNYQGNHICLDSPLMQLTVADTGRLNRQQFHAYHFFDLKKHSHYGTVTLDQGDIFLKWAGVVFHSVNGDIHITPNQIECPGLSAVSENISFLSDITIGLQDDGAMRLDIESHKYAGTVSDTKKFLQYFGVSLLDTVIFQGDIEIGRRDFLFSLTRKSQENDFNMQINGNLKSGQYQSDSLDLRLENTTVDFMYNYKAHRLELFDVMGDLFLGKDDVSKKYSLATYYLHFSDFPKLACDFDIYLKDTHKDLIRLKGAVELPKGDLNQQVIVLDAAASHLGETCIGGEIVVLDTKHLVQLNLEYESNLATLKENISHFALSGLAALDLLHVEQLNSVHLDGHIKGTIQFDTDSKVCTFCSSGDDVVVQDSAPSHFLLSAWKQADKWVFEQIKYDRFNINAEIKHSQDSLEIAFLRLRYAHNILLDLKCTYNRAAKSLETKIQSLDIDFQKNHDFNLLPKWAYLDRLSGKMQLSGTLDYHFHPQAPWLITSSLNCNLVDVKIDHIKLEDKQNIVCQFSLDQDSFCINDFALSLLEFDGKPLPIDLKIENLTHQFQEKKWLLDSMQFTITSKAFMEMINLSQQWFPEQFRGGFSEILHAIEQNNDIKGMTKCEWSSYDWVVELMLDDDNYTLLNQSYPIKDFYFSYDSFRWNLQCQTFFQDYPYWLQVTKDAPTNYAGTLILSDEDPMILEAEGIIPLTAYWQWQEEDGFSIQRVGGTIGGLDLRLTRQNDYSASECLALVGQMKMDIQQLSDRLPTGIKGLLQRLQLGSGYELTGRLFIPKKEIHNFKFEGLFGGQDFSLMDYELKSLSSRITCKSDQIEVRQFKISDPAGEVKVDRITLAKTEGQPWNFSIPLLEIENLRPSLLHHEGEEVSKTKPLMIDHFEIKELHGDFSSGDTVKGVAKLQFHKTIRKQASLLDIPVHLISRLGFDLSMLIPTQGTVIFEFKESKMYLTKFVDVFSHEKRCRFYLAKNPSQSFIDFNGNLDLQIKMKQYVLLKVTQPFILSVRGSLAKPSYHLQKRASHLKLGT